MTLTTESLRAALDYANLQAILHVIREGESSQDAIAYRTLYGGGTFDDYSHHPNRVVTAGAYTSTAAGAYQILYRSWLDFRDALGEVPPFTPEWQDLYAVWAIVKKRRALPEILAGDLEGTLAKLSWEWSSIPPSRYGQHTMTFEKCRAVYLQYGGKLADLADRPDPAPIEERGRDAEPAGSKSLETPMPLPILAIISAFGPLLAELIPTVAKAFDKQSETPAKIEAATKIIDTVVRATGASNIQAAVELMQSSPEALTIARNAVVTEPSIMGLLEIGGGIEGARTANLAVQNSDKPFWYNPAFWFVLTAVVPPLYGVVGVLLWRMPEPSEQLVTQVVTGILGLAAVAGAYYLGSTQGSAQKTAIIAHQATK